MLPARRPGHRLSSHDIALLLSADLLVSGISTIIRSVGIGKIMGVRLPEVAGATFTVLNPMILIATQYGGRNRLPYVYRAMLISGIFGLLLAKPFAMSVRFGPRMAGTTICIIGLSLGGADITLITGKGDGQAGSMSRIGLAGLVVLIIIVVTRPFKGLVGRSRCC